MALAVACRAVAGVIAGRDDWSLRVRPDQRITLSTATPQPPGSLANLIQPSLEVRDADGILVASNTGGAADQFNAGLTVTVPGTVPAAGAVWNVRVVNLNAHSGEYLLFAGVTTARDFFDEWAGRSLPGASAAGLAPSADPDRDGWSNLVEYGTGRDPASPDGPAPLQISGGPALHLALPPVMPPGVTCSVEHSLDLTPGSWTLIAARTGTAPWHSPFSTTPQPNAGGGWELAPANPGRGGFYRLRFTLSP